MVDYCNVAICYKKCRNDWECGVSDPHQFWKSRFCGQIKICFRAALQKSKNFFFHLIVNLWQIDKNVKENIEII